MSYDRLLESFSSQLTQILDGRRRVADLEGPALVRWLEQGEPDDEDEER